MRCTDSICKMNEALWCPIRVCSLNIPSIRAAPGLRAVGEGIPPVQRLEHSFSPGGVLMVEAELRFPAPSGSREVGGRPVQELPWGQRRPAGSARPPGEQRPGPGLWRPGCWISGCAGPGLFQSEGPVALCLLSSACRWASQSLGEAWMWGIKERKTQIFSKRGNKS